MTSRNECTVGYSLLEVPHFIASADAALMLDWLETPNLLNALPNGFFQAIAAGLPQIDSRVLPQVANIADSYRLGLGSTRGPRRNPGGYRSTRGRPERDGGISVQFGTRGQRAQLGAPRVENRCDDSAGLERRSLALRADAVSKGCKQDGLGA